MKLRPIKTNKLIKILVKLGFGEQRQTGSHKTFLHPDGRKTIVPVHGNEDIGVALLNPILKQIRLDREEFERILGEI